MADEGFFRDIHLRSYSFYIRAGNQIYGFQHVKSLLYSFVGSRTYENNCKQQQKILHCIYLEWYTLRRCYKWPPYIFCACSGNKNRSYKIIILWKNLRLCRDSANYLISKWQVDIAKTKPHFKKSHFLVWYKSVVVGTVFVLSVVTILNRFKHNLQRSR